MHEKQTARRTRIAEDWQPGADGRAFAEGLGIDVEREAPGFLDYHLAHGSLMLSWAAAWRSWCRRAVEYGHATGQRNLPLLSVVAAVDPADLYGATAWAASVAGTMPDRSAEGALVPHLAGYDAAGVARDCCAAAGLAPEWRGDLSIVASWLLDGVDPDEFVAVIRRASRPARPITSMRYYDRAVMDRRQRA
jgi:hypothetical protein